MTLFVYGGRHAARLSFVEFYAGLQEVPQDTLESVMVDGASSWERIKYVTIPHLMPLFGSAVATSFLTIGGEIILLSSVLIRTWRDFNRNS